MANWQRRIRLQPEWGRADRGEISMQELARVLADRVRNVRDFASHTDLNNERDEIADDFECLSGEDDADFCDFDNVMGRLYDWADTQIGGQFFDAKRVCWIDTIGSPHV